ncbi:PREDICTED: ethanolaminephosphotransferase 1-like [Priapulus caudatus]|uniref:Ethanolaminephosphotransferase 1-like n=1 Tax=Priapulus caudatus TaxID=37621 RepID=A0ABM1EQU6_PRICU|nr:PREDICTED: ethanolaminephosphotransferase 1-like [Priapulus caudatus]
MAIKYMSAEQLEGFDVYKYSCVDTSPLSKYVMHPFWNLTVKILPHWLAPNLMTFTGFLLLVVNFVVLSYYDFHFFASSDYNPDYLPVPGWVWLFCAFTNFFAHTLDGCDGKQARRTQSSSPLGELFDHGVDSWATSFLPIALYSVYGRADGGMIPLRTYFIIWSVQIVFIASHWEKYITKVLFLPWGYDISQVAMTVVYVITFAKGYEFWKFSFHIGPVEVTVPGIVEVGVYTFSIGLSLSQTLWNIYKAYRDQTGKMLSFYEAMIPLLPVTMLLIFSTMWAFLSPTNIMELQPRTFFFFTGTVFSNITCRLIVAQMAGTRAEMWNWLLVPVMVTVTTVVFVPSLYDWETYMLYALTAAVTLCHLHYGVFVVRQMAQHLGISVFTIRKKED